MVSYYGGQSIRPVVDWSLKTCTAGEESLLPSAHQRLESTQLSIANVSPSLLQRAVCYTNWPKATRIQCVTVYQNAGSETCWPLPYLLSSYQHSKDARLENSWFHLSVHRSLGYRAFQLSTSIKRLFRIFIYNYVHICVSMCGFITVSVVLMEARGGHWTHWACSHRGYELPSVGAGSQILVLCKSS